MKASRFIRSSTLLLPLLGALGVAAAEESPSPAPSPGSPMGMPAEPEPLREWLDEVRAQRRAWEERRQAAREAMDARRRWIDPWGAAKKEAREKETQRRREALREHIEREREAFRGNSRPWGMRPDPLQEAPPSESGEPSRDTAPQQGDPDADVGISAPDSPYPPLPGWDNRWYYRGY